MTLSAQNATPLKPTKSRNLDSSVFRSTNSNWPWHCGPISICNEGFHHWLGGKQRPSCVAFSLLARLFLLSRSRSFSLAPRPPHPFINSPATVFLKSSRKRKASDDHHTHPPRPTNCILFCLEGLFLFRSLSTDPRTYLCKRSIEDFHRAQIVKFVSFTGAFTSKYVVKSVKETCETVSSIPKETCQNATHFD